MGLAAILGDSRAFRRDSLRNQFVPYVHPRSCHATIDDCNNSAVRVPRQRKYTRQVVTDFSSDKVRTNGLNLGWLLRYCNSKSAGLGLWRFGFILERGSGEEANRSCPTVLTRRARY